MSPLTLLYGHATDALRAADVALVASGTATLEAAMARCPHVLFYRVSSVTAGIVRRKILIHVNTTNPVLDEDSPERAALAAAGWEVAEDGMEIAF